MTRICIYFNKIYVVRFFIVDLFERKKKEKVNKTLGFILIHTLKIACPPFNIFLI